MPSASLGIVLKLKLRSVVFISSSSDSPEYLEDSSVISSVKILLAKKFSNWLVVRVDILLTFIYLWLSSDINLSILFYLKLTQIFSLL